MSLSKAGCDNSNRVTGNELAIVLSQVENKECDKKYSDGHCCHGDAVRVINGQAAGRYNVIWSVDKINCCIMASKKKQASTPGR